MLAYTVRTTAYEIEDIIRCYDLSSINSAVDKLLQEQYGETVGNIVSVSIDSDPVNSDIIVVTVLKR